MTYSAALYDPDHAKLEDAQYKKYQRILNSIGDGASSLLEIGCGWGAFAEEASKKINDITCLTFHRRSMITP